MKPSNIILCKCGLQYQGRGSNVSLYHDYGFQAEAESMQTLAFSDI